MLDLSVPLQGLNRAEAELNSAAAKIAQASLSAGSPPANDAVDLSTEIVALLSAKNDFAANARVIHTIGDLNQSLVNLLG